MTIPVSAQGKVVGVVHVDGAEIRGDWRRSEDGKSVEILVAGTVRRIALEDVARITFAQEKDAGSSSHKDEVVFRLADGGRLWGEIVAPAADAVVARTALGKEAFPLPFDRLAGVRFAADEAFPRANQLFREALSDRLPGEDILVTRSVGDAKKVRGRLESINPEGGTFVFGKRSRSFRLEKMFGVVFAAGGGEKRKDPITFELCDGSTFSGELKGADQKSIRVSSSLGFDVDVLVRRVCEIRVRSARVVYLSDLTPIRERIEGRLHKPWPIQRDRNVAGGPIRLGGRRFAKGLGVHSLTELIYATDGDYATFVATIGVDDAVQPRGSVLFRVLGDDGVLFESAVIHGYDEPEKVRVDVSRSKTVTLVVDYGDGLDLSDQADWGDARFLRPVNRKHRSIPRTR